MRNPYCDHIPAEGLNVGELDLNDAIEFLLMQSRGGAAGKMSKARTEAAEIVKELGYLPLGAVTALVSTASSLSLISFNTFKVPS